MNYMKKLMVILCVLFVSVAKAQSDDVQQLVLDIQKLTQLKSILKDMQQGYTIISKGYTAVSDIAKGNFNLHEIFIDGLMAVSPVVKNYSRVSEIISYQTEIVKEYKSSYNKFTASGHFNANEINYIGKVYSNLFNESLKNLDALLMVVTASNLRMNDAERLRSIDKIYDNIQDRLIFLRQFNNSTAVLALQRAKENNDVSAIQSLYDVK